MSTETGDSSSAASDRLDRDLLAKQWIAARQADKQATQRFLLQAAQGVLLVFGFAAITLLAIVWMADTQVSVLLVTSIYGIILFAAVIDTGRRVRRLRLAGWAPSNEPDVFAAPKSRPLAQVLPQVIGWILFLAAQALILHGGN